MKHYFEITYPRRLEELKGKLEPIAVKAFEWIGKDNKEEAVASIQEFQDELDKFVNNTKLHIMGLKTVSPNYTQLVTRDYLIEYLGKHTRAGQLVGFLRTRKKEE